MASFFLGAGELPMSTQDCPTERSIVCWRSVVTSCGSAPTRACIAETAKTFVRSSCRRDSDIWVGTTRGLLRINAKGISFSEENELRGDGGIKVLFEDREGNLWIGGARGLGRIRDSAFVTYSSVNDPHFEHNGPIYVDREGRTWFAPTQGGLYVLQNGRVRPITSIPPNEVVYSIAGGGDHVWVGR